MGMWFTRSVRLPSGTSTASRQTRVTPQRTRASRGVLEEA